jgi:hypothetical protein
MLHVPRLRNLLGILLEFLKYPIFLGRDVSCCRNMELVTQWMMRIVIVRMIVKKKKKVVLGVLLYRHDLLHLSFYYFT